MFSTLCARYWLADFPPIEERRLKVLLPAPASAMRRKWTKERPEVDPTFELLFKNNPLPLWVYDLETLRFLDINEVACQKYGYLREEFLALTMRDIRPPEDIPRMHASVRAHRTGNFDSSIWRHRKKDGTTIYTECVSHEIVYKGRRARFVCPIDITDRLTVEAGQAKLSKALQEREAGLHHAQRMAKLAHVITGPDGSFESWSETLPELIGVDPSHMLQSTREWLEILHPSDRAMFRAKALEARVTGARTDLEYRIRRADGAWIQVRQAVEPIPGYVDANRGMRWFSTMQDVTEQKRAETNIRHLNRVHAVLSGINTLIVRVRDREELYRESCRIAVEAGGFEIAWIGMVDKEARRIKPVAWQGTDESYLKLMPLGLDPDRPDGRGLAGQTVRGRKAMMVEDMTSDSRIKLRKQAQERGLHSLVMLPLVIADEAVGVLALYATEIGFFDAAEMRLLHELGGDIAFALDHIDKAERLDYLALYDPLTELPNRQLFDERLNQYLAAAIRDKTQLAVVIVDVERFHAIHDTLGRRTCDELLKQIGARCARMASDPKLAARLVGDQFAILLTDVKSEDNIARMLEQRNHEIFECSYCVRDIELAITAKFGIAVFPGDAENAESLLKNAEAALNRAKTTGERYLFYTQQMSDRVAGHLTFENKLRHALEKNEFVLYYQPTVDVETRRITGVEALMRWQSAEHGFLPPAAFIPLLEETGMILDVGAWALRQAVADHHRWLAQSLLAPRIAVNVSAIQLRHRDFIEIVRSAIGQNGETPVIGIEITESVIVDDIDATVTKLRAVRDMGLNIAIDDFGTGYSSLLYLAKLPVHSLKIDRSFIIAMADDPDTMTLVSTIISLAHSLRLKVVAEGVETEDQAKILRLLRCDEMQGYLISRPVPELELQDILRRQTQ